MPAGQPAEPWLEPEASTPMTLYLPVRPHAQRIPKSPETMPSADDQVFKQ